MSAVSVHPTMGIPPNGINIVGDKISQQFISLSLPSFQELQPKEEDIPLLAYGKHMQYKKEEDFALAVTNCERVPGDSSTKFGAFMVSRLLF